LLSSIEHNPQNIAIRVEASWDVRTGPPPDHIDKEEEEEEEGRRRRRRRERRRRRRRRRRMRIVEPQGLPHKSMCIFGKALRLLINLGDLRKQMRR